MIVMTPPWHWPVPQAEPTSVYAPPSSRWGPGHRGIDVAAGVGATVRAVAAGRVVFAGEVGGVPTVSIEHGQVRSTYQPVRAAVRIGQQVSAGEPIGEITGSLGHCPSSCLHLGAKTEFGYLDPSALLRPRRVVLKPLARSRLGGALG